VDIAALWAEMKKRVGEDSNKSTKSDLSSAVSQLLKFRNAPDLSRNSVAVSHSERQRRYYKREKQRRLEDICVLDFETDPFDNTRNDPVYPFLAVLYRRDHEPIIIWDDDHEALIDKVILQIETMEGRYTIYAHNGGRFDYKFFLHKLRGEIKFKGNSIMKATIGEHELRDSLHILPTNLASLQKDHFDYSKMHRSVRNKHRDEIIQYCVNDCKYALDFIQFFVQKHGLKISIGQAAFAGLKRLYPTIENLGSGLDAVFREFFYGGRVEFFEGHIHEKGQFDYIDLNSAYPAVMAHVKHPIGRAWIEDNRITKDTFFIDLDCHSTNALMTRIKNSAGVWETRCPIGRYNFKTTIHEYKAALELGLIKDIKINKTWNCAHSTTFADFIIPLYNERRAITVRMKTLEEGSDEWALCNKNQTVIKFELTNSYGKFAQNPARYKEYMQLDMGEMPDGDGWRETEFCGTYIIWERPNPDYRYNNVATGASITGAQRAVLMRALNAVKRPLYCDTDSIICEDIGALELDDTKLGAWKKEATLDELVINGKKHYAYHNPKKSEEKAWTVRCKGAGGITLEQIIEANRGNQILVKPKGPTLFNDGSQKYIGRTVRTTGLSERIRDDGKTIWNSDTVMDAVISQR
jgi:hypothetical protein